MNQVSENLPLKEAREEYNLNRAFWKHDRRILAAKREIQIFKNVVEGQEEQGKELVSTDLMKNALLSILEELER